jgi:2-keto-3-deoxy-L-rhamnonate aldolase RhmA
MRNSKILAKLRAGQPARLAMLGHYVPSFVAFAAHYGYDGIWLDLEHRPMDAREVQALLAFFHRYDLDCMVRPATAEKGLLTRYLEDGATGLMMPQVASAAAARELVSKVKFPPVGDRGVEGRGLDADFALATGGDWNRLVEHARRETFLALQIETPAALAQVEEIAAVPGVEALFIGPSDLTLRMQQLPEAQRISLPEAYQRVGAAARAHGLAWGAMPRTLDQVRDLAGQGAQLLLWGNDQRLLQDGLAQSSAELDAALSLSRP